MERLPGYRSARAGRGDPCTGTNPGYPARSVEIPVRKRFGTERMESVDEKPYSDSALWLVFTLVAYLKETGDVKILDEVVPFYDQGKASVREHIDRALSYFENNKGAHDLILIRFGDWNDSLTAVGREGRGGGVWLRAISAGLRTYCYLDVPARHPPAQPQRDPRRERPDRPADVRRLLHERHHLGLAAHDHDREPDQPVLPGRAAAHGRRGARDRSAVLLAVLMSYYLWVDSCARRARRSRHEAIPRLVREPVGPAALARDHHLGLHGLGDRCRS